MACACDAVHKKTFYSNIQLWSDNQQGIPGGSAINIGMLPVVVCTQCGTAEFKIPEQDMSRWFRRGKLPA